MSSSNVRLNHFKKTFSIFFGFTPNCTIAIPPLTDSLYSNIKLDLNQFEPNVFEYRLLRKIIEWPKIVDIASKKLEPHRVTFYLYELATIFHSYWSEGNKKDEFKFILNGKINKKASFKIFQLISIILENGMSILGVSLPKRM